MSKKAFANPLERVSAGTTAAEAPSEGIAPAVMRRDGGTQMRAALNDGVLADYREAYEEGKELGPVDLVYDGEAHWLWDGFHRSRAWADVHGEETPMPSRVQAGTRRDAVLLAVAANGRHGLPRDAATKVRAVDTLLLDQEWGAWSNREIAKRTETSHTFVAGRRRALVASGALVATERVKYVDRHGRETVMDVTGVRESNRERASEDESEDESEVESEVEPEVESEVESEVEPEVESEPEPAAMDAWRLAGAAAVDRPRASGPEAGPGLPEDLLEDLPEDLVGLGWALRQVAGVGTWYAYRARSHARPGRATPTSEDVSLLIELARQIEKEDGPPGEDPGLGPVVTVGELSRVSVETILRYNRGLSSMAVRDEIRIEIERVMMEALGGIDG